MTAPERIWPVGGYAPGSYWCRCSQCGGNFQGDKRAFECHDCVIQALLRKTTPEALAASPEVQALIAAAETRVWNAAIGQLRATASVLRDRDADDPLAKLNDDFAGLLATTLKETTHD